MKILYIHQYFKTPQESGATRSYWIAQEFIKRGHKVTMLCASDGKKHQAGVEFIDGIEVHYVVNPYDNYMSAPSKVWSFLKFIKLAINEGKRLKDIDMIYATSTPLTVGYIAMRLKRKKGWPYIFEVRDLWPEFPIQVGAIRNKLAIRYLRLLERSIYKQSDFVVALSPGMQEGVIDAGTPIEKTVMIPNMSKPDKYYPHEPDASIVERFKIDLQKFNVIHFGSMGRANGLQYIIEAAKECKERGAKDIEFLFLGNGATEPLLKGLCEKYNLDNVRFLGYHNLATVAEVVNCCDASITSFMDLPILKTNSPNKLFDSLSAGKPIIVNSAGWTKDMVEENNCGFYVDVNHPEELAAKLIEVKDNKELLAEWGRNARRLSIEKYDKDILTAQVVDVVEKVYSKYYNK